MHKVSPSSVYDRQPYMLLYTRKAPKPAPDPSYKPTAAAVASRQAAASSIPRKLSQAEAQQAVMSRITTAPAALSGMAADTFSGSSASSSGELPAVTASDTSASSSTSTTGSAAAASSASNGVEGHKGVAGSSQQQQTDHMQGQQQEHSTSNGDGAQVSSKGDAAGASADAADTGSGSSDEDDAGLASGLTDTQRARRNKKKKERLKRKKAREAAGGAAEDEGGTVAAVGSSSSSSSSSKLGKVPADSDTAAVANGHDSVARGSSSGSPSSSDSLEALAAVAVGCGRGSTSRRSSGSGEELPVQHHRSEAQHKKGEPPGSPHSWSTARSCASASASPASSSARSFASATSLPPFPAAKAPRLPEPNMRYRKYLMSAREHPSGGSTWHLHLLTDLPGVTQAAEEIGMHLAEGILALQVPGKFLLPGMTLPGVPRHALLVSCKWKCEKQQLSMRLEWPAEEGVYDLGRRSSGGGSSHAYSTDF